MCGVVPRFHDMPLTRSSCGPLGTAPALEIDMMQETISRARELLKRSRQYAEKLRRESEGAEQVETRVRADSDSIGSSASRSRTASDDTGYRSSSPADTLPASTPPTNTPPANTPPANTHAPAHKDGGADPPLTTDVHHPGRPDRTPYAVKERLKKETSC